MKRLVLVLALASCNAPPPSTQGIPQGEAVIPKHPLVIRAGQPVADMPGEPHLKNVRQLSFGGENAEAYWSNDGRKLIFQSQRPPFQCDQIYIMDLESTEEPKLVSTGKGKTTCSYFMLGDRQILYASTHLGDAKCPTPKMFFKNRYVWPVYPTFDIFKANLDGSGLVRLTDTPGYDAEATVCPVTGRIVFTSARDGDLEVYSMEQDGSDVKRLTNHVGYDGGPFFSHNGASIVYRRAFFQDQKEEQESVDFLKNDVVVPARLEIMIMDRDGKNPRQVTDNGKANFAPYFFPDDRRILFSSNQADPKGRDFDIYAIDVDGKNQEKITNYPSFDGFPMFSPDGKHLVFASNRYGKAQGETNLFVAEWVEKPLGAQAVEGSAGR